MRGVGRRWVRAVVGLVFAALMANVATGSAYASELALPALHLPSTAGLVKWFKGAEGWVLPEQESGSAADRTHLASAASTRSGRGNGRPAGTGRGALPAYSPVAARRTSGVSGIAQTGFDPRTSVRVAEKSSAFVTWYQNADGSFTRKVSQVPVNYKDASGVWQPIDTTLVKSSSGRWASRANSFGVSFAGGVATTGQSGALRAQADSTASPSPSPAPSVSASPSVTSAPGPSTGELATVDLSAGESVAWSLSGAASVTPVVSGDTAAYAGILPDTTLDLTSESYGVDESLVLASSSAANSWTFPLALSGVSLSQASDGTWELSDSSGDEVAYLASPYAYDSDVDADSGLSAQTHDVSYSLATEGGVEELTMTLDPSWLDDPARVFPVTVDPSVTVSIAGQTATTYVSSAYTNDYSSDTILDVGYDTTQIARSFFMFPSASIVDTGYHVTAAQFAGFLTHAWNTATADEKYDVNTVTSSWSVTGDKSWPGPSISSSPIGTWAGTQDAASTCSIGGVSTSGNWTYTPLSTTPFDSWSTGGSSYYGLALTGYSETDADYWKLFASSRNSGCSPYLYLTYSADVAPQINSMSPSSGSTVSTLTPSLAATGSDPDSWPDPLKYQFALYPGAGGSPIATSTWQTGPAWAVPSGLLKWGQTYQWRVQNYDGFDYSSVSYNSFVTTAPPPLLTSELSQNTDGHGYSASIGNYTTSAVDANVATVGPALQIERDYNSLDPRSSGAFGAGWSSVLDAMATQVLDASGNLQEVVVTYPDGSQVPFGYNADGTYSPPPGRSATLTYSAGSGYTLIDQKDTVYTFGFQLATEVTKGSTDSATAYGLSSITDDAGRSLDMERQHSGIFPPVSGLESSASGRSLQVTWATPAGATYAHVASVSTDPVTAGNTSTTLNWTYSYNGDELTKVCDPQSQCTSYSYQTGSQYQNAVLDDAPASYWPLSDLSLSGSTAAGAVLANEQADAGTYAHVGLRATSGIAGTGATAASFNGSNSSVTLPSGLVGPGAVSWSVSLWFATTGSSEVLFSHSASAISAGTTTTAYQPTLYIGSDGKLIGGVGVGSDIVTSAAQNTGAWHHVVFAESGTSDWMYLDGALVGSGTAGPDSVSEPYTYVGTGFLGGSWQDEAHSSGSTAYASDFSGSISDVSFYNRALTAVDAANLYTIGTTSSALLTKIVKPSGAVEAQVTYNTVTGRVTGVTDENGGTWTVSAPTVAGSSQVYRSAVLGTGPSSYYRLGDPAGASSAVNQVNTGTGAYNSVTLGGAGVFSDTSAASFNGTSSYVAAPSTISGTGSYSVSAWVNLASLGSSDQTAVALTASNQSPFQLGYFGSTGTWWFNRPNLNASGSGGTYAASSVPASTGTWTQLVGVYDASTSPATMQLYVNGVLAASASDTWAPFAGTGTLMIGRDQYDAGFADYLNGSLGEVAAWPSALSAQQVSTLYAAAKNSSGIVPVETVRVADPGSTQISIPFNGTSYSASVRQTWQGEATRLVFQADGNLVVYRDDTGAAVWASNTSGYPAATLSFQTDGNLVIYNGSTVLWASGTDGNADESAIVSASGNVTIVGALGQQIWQTATSIPTAAHVISYAYDPQNAYRLIAETDALGETTTYGYDTSGFLHTVTDPNGDVITTGDDVRGNQVSKSTCQVMATDTCSTEYWTYYPDDTTAILATLSVKNNLPMTYSDARSSSAGDTAYQTKYTYDALGDLTGVTTPPVAGYPSGRTTTTRYTDGTSVLAYGSTTAYAPPGLAYQLTTPGGAVTSTKYYADGDIASVTNPLGEVTVYTYDNIGRVLTKTVTYGSTSAVTSYTYDGDGRIVTETDPATMDAVTGATHIEVTTSSYDPDGDLTQSVVSDAGTGDDAPRTTTTGYNACDQITSVTDPDGNKTSYTYDAYGNKATVSDPLGNVTDYTYDADGDLLTTVLENYTGDPVVPLAPVNLTLESRAYDPAGRLASVTDAMGRVTSYTYTDNGLTASVTVSEGSSSTQTVRSQYDAAGNLLKQWTNAGVTETDYTYDAAGRVLTKVLDPNAIDQVTTYTYTADDKVANQTVTAGGASVVTADTYDAGGNVLSQAVSGDGTTRTTTWVRDARGLAISMTNPLNQTTSYVYDTAGRLTQTTLPAVTGETYSTSTMSDTAVTAYPVSLIGYDAFGEKNETEDADGVVTTYAYDADGNVVMITGAAYTPVGSSTPITPVETRTYDADGRLATDVSPLNETTSYTYDQLGDQAKVVDPAGGVTHDTFDVDGEELSSTSPAGTVTGATYDYLGRTLTTSVVESALSATLTTNYVYGTGGWLATQTSPAGVGVSYTYDALGEKKTVTDGAGNTTTYSYDGFGHVVKTLAADNTYTTDTYDALGDVISTGAYNAAGALQSAITATYDKTGNQLSSTNALDDTTTFAYDASGLLTGETQPVTSSTSITVSYGYDLAGHKTRYTDGRGDSWYWTYNALGTQDAAVVPAAGSYTTAANRVTSYVYDADGDLTGETLPGGVTQSATYDSLGDLLTQSGSGADAATATRTFTYDPDGNVLTTATSNTAVTGSNATSETYTYDSEDELLTAAGSAGSSSFAYNSDGLMVGRTDASGSTSYTYDDADRLATVADPLMGTTAAYAYTPVGQVASVTYGAGGDVRSFTYDTSHEVTQDKLATSSGAQVAAISYGYDAAGELTSKTDLTGTANSYAYDEAGRLITWSNGTTSTAYGYDAASNRTSIISTTISTSAVTSNVTDTYDARDEITVTSDSVKDTTGSYTYSPRGTLTGSTSGVITTPSMFDAYGQQIVSGVSTYTYDAAGRMTNRTTPTTSTTYAYSGTGNALASDGSDLYTHDPDGNVYSTSIEGGAGRVVWLDAHTDVVGDFSPTTASGLQGTAAYDPLGNQIAATGNATGLSIGYQSGYTDPSTGQVNMSARWYSPSSGQFTSADTVDNSATPDPANANPFGYANASPLDGIDPSGHCTGWSCCLTGNEAACVIGIIGNSQNNSIDPNGDSCPYACDCYFAGVPQDDCQYYNANDGNGTDDGDRCAGLSVQACVKKYDDQDPSNGSRNPGGSSNNPQDGDGGGRGGGSPGSGCDIACQAARWLQDIEHLSSEGRTVATYTIGGAVAAESAAGSVASAIVNTGLALGITAATALIGDSGTSGDTTKNNGSSCLTGGWTGSTIDYWATDPNNGNRAMGADACLVAPLDQGSSVPNRTKPPGYRWAQDYADGLGLRARDTINACHLIGNQLGGSGTDLSNLATCARGANANIRGSSFTPMINIEKAVRAAVDTGQRVYYQVVPDYEGSRTVPTGFYIYANGVMADGSLCPPGGCISYDKVIGNILVGADGVPHNLGTAVQPNGSIPEGSMP
jgi:large repetitive protein